MIYVIYVPWSVCNSLVSLQSLSAHFCFVTWYSDIFFYIFLSTLELEALNPSSSNGWILHTFQVTALKCHRQERSFLFHSIYCSSHCCPQGKPFSCRLYPNQHILFAQLFTCSLLWKVRPLRTGLLAFATPEPTLPDSWHALNNCFTVGWAKETQGCWILFQFCS